MLKSLFGDLGSLGQAAAGAAGMAARPDDFVATAVMETRQVDFTEGDRVIDRHTRDVFVSGSAADAMRHQLRTIWADGAAGGARRIMLFDPARMWSAAVVKTVADTGGQPVERLHLRDQATLATLAMVERTSAPRHGELLKLYHADLRETLPDGASVPLALMEASHLTAVVIGPMHSAAIDALLASLVGATRSPAWQCPQLVFFLPVGAPWIERKIRSVPWPRKVAVHALSQPLGSAAEVWNLLLAQWDVARLREKAAALPPLPPPAELPARLAGQPGTPTPAQPPTQRSARTSDWSPTEPSDQPADQPSDHLSSQPLADHPFDQPAVQPSAQSPAPLPAAALPQPGGRDPGRRGPDEWSVLRAMRALAAVDGFVGTALARADNGSLLATEGGGPLDLELAAAVATDALRTHLRNAHHFVAPPPTHLDEFTLSAGGRHVVVQPLDTHPQLFVLLVVDAARCSLETARQHLQQARRELG